MVSNYYTGTYFLYSLLFLLTSETIPFLFAFSTLISSLSVSFSSILFFVSEDVKKQKLRRQPLLVQPPNFAPTQGYCDFCLNDIRGDLKRVKKYSLYIWNFYSLKIFKKYSKNPLWDPISEVYTNIFFGKFALK